MTAKICADIKPTGVRQKDLVDLMYQMTAALEGLCDKLDADDAAVTTYASGCIDAVMNCTIEDSQGHRYYNYLAETSAIHPHMIINGRGIGNKDLVEWMYDWAYTFYLMCVKLDASGGVDTATYTADCYTTYLLDRIVNGKDDAIGAGTDYTFTSVGVYNEKQVVQWFYHSLAALELLSQMLDDDATLTDTDYESLWFTNTILLTVEDGYGDRIGN